MPAHIPEKPPLTDRQREVYEFLAEKVDGRGRAPTIREIGARFGIGTCNGVLCHLSALERKGLIARDPNVARAIRLTRPSEPQPRLPLVGRFVADVPVLIDEDCEQVDFGDLFDAGECFCLRVKGVALADVHLADGDYVVVRKRGTPRDGDLVAALLDGEGAVLLRYRSARRRLRLAPLDEASKTHVAGAVTILGRVAGVVRAYGSEEAVEAAYGHEEEAEVPPERSPTAARNSNGRGDVGPVVDRRTAGPLRSAVRRPDGREAHQLAREMRDGDLAAFRRFVELHLRLAGREAERCCRRWGIEQDEAEQIAAIGLLEAATRYEPDSRLSFRLFGTRSIRWSCARLGLEARFLVAIPQEEFRECTAFLRERSRLSAGLPPVVSRKRIEWLFQCRPEMRDRFGPFERARDVRSLSDRREPEYREARRLVDPADGPLEQTIRDEFVRAAVDSLPPRQRTVIQMRYGLDEEPKTLDQVGASIGRTGEAVRQIQRLAEERLRRTLRRML